MKINFRKNDGNGNKRRWGKIIVFGIIIAGVGAASFMWYRNKNANAEIVGLTITMERAQKMDISKMISASGTIEISEETEVYGAAQSKVKTVHFKEDDYIKAGDILVTYDIEQAKEELEQSLRKAEITLNNAEITLAGISESSYESEFAKLRNNIAAYDNTIANTEANIAQVREKVAVAQKKAADAADNLKKYTELLEVGGISEAELKTYEKAYEDAMTEISELENQISAYERTIAETESNKAQTELEIKLTQSDMEKNKEDTNQQYQKQLNEIETCKLNIEGINSSIAELVEFTESTASGIITTLSVVEGSDVSGSSPIAIISDMENLIVKANIPEYDAPKLKLGQKVNIMSDGFPDQVFTGELSSISRTASEQTTSNGTETVVQVEANLDSGQDSLKPGYTVDIEVVIEEAKDVVAVPISAVKTDRETEGKYVFLFDRGTAVRTDVTTGVSDDMYMEVDGLEEGASVITNPSEEIVDGVQVAPEGMGGPGQGRANEGGNMFMMGPRPGGTSTVIRQGGGPSGGGPGGGGGAAPGGGASRQSAPAGGGGGR